MEDRRAPVGRRKPRPIQIEAYPSGKRTDQWIPLFEDALGAPIEVPFIIARGARPGPVLGITAAVHGNELNGIKIILNLLEDLPLKRLTGALLCVPTVNVPGFNAGTREFSDGADLNQVFPGSADGTPSQQYVRAFVSTFLPPCTHLIDIHTASEGWMNTLYVRADLSSESCRRIAYGFNPQIILHAPPNRQTLRATAARKGIAAVTVEAGSANVIHGKTVYEAEVGIRNIMTALEMLDGAAREQREPFVCGRSRWLRTTGGGLLETYFKLYQILEKGQLLGIVRDAFGNELRRYVAPFSGVVIARATNPVATPGLRFCHLGDVGSDPFPPSGVNLDGASSQQQSR
ncbi:MAG: succinylglutamate desuccinylase/aspartoacylase family protein [Armatimonadetes bacterium]|nr:succinylglutamate desuccinylase/aspartoacylase family protein [Armatimonadota bacterium]